MLQYINCKRVPGQPFASPEVIEREVLPFPERYQNLAAALASQAGVAIQGAQRLEELRVALQKLEASQQQMVQAERLSALGEMAAGVAHDFNNLLAVVVGRSELLLKMQEPDVMRAFRLRQAAGDGAQTVRRILNSPGRQTRPAGRVDLPDLLRDVVADPHQVEGRSPSRFLRRTGRGRTCSSWRISAELREVVMNLLINGLDAMPRGGQFDFRVSCDGETVTVAAADSGCGMSEETRWRVLEPFFTTKGARGTGLGLSVSWGIVKRHGGSIEIESSPGVGSIFKVCLPVSAEAPAAESQAASSPPVRPARAGHDDEPEVRSVPGRCWCPLATVVEAASGEEAWPASGPVDVILTDVSMPGMAGWDADACQQRFPQVPLGRHGVGDDLIRKRRSAWRACPVEALRSC